MKKNMVILWLGLSMGCLDNSEGSKPAPKSVETNPQKKVLKKEKPPATSKRLISKNAELQVFRIYGELAPDGYLDSANPITEKYGFRVERIAGCEVGTVESTLADYQNRKALEAMNEKYGKDWRAAFEKETTYKLSIPH